MASPQDTSNSQDSPMNSLSISELKALQAKLAFRQRFIGSWASALDGFFTGFYDGLALSNILWLISGTALLAVFPPAGVILIAIGLATAVTRGVVEANTEYDREKNKIDETLTLLEEAVGFAKEADENPGKRSSTTSCAQTFYRP